MFTLWPLAGLGNRMRALDSAVQFAGEHRMSFDLVWELNHELNAPLETLFEPLPHVRKTTTVSSLNRRGLLLRNLYETLLLKPRINHTLSNDEVLQLRKQNPAVMKLLLERRVLIKTWERFYRPGAPYRNFFPVPALRARIEALNLEFGSTVGVHLRRTDNKISLATSTTDRFVSAMQAELEQDPATHFFVCTDSPEEESVLRDRFGSRIHTLVKRSLDRGKPEAIEDAVVDLWCLSRCRRLLGSHYSSFSETAGEVGLIECVLVGADPKQ